MVSLDEKNSLHIRVTEFDVPSATGLGCVHSNDELHEKEAALVHTTCFLSYVPRQSS